METALRDPSQWERWVIEQNVGSMASSLTPPSCSNPPFVGAVPVILLFPFRDNHMEI